MKILLFCKPQCKMLNHQDTRRDNLILTKEMERVGISFKLKLIFKINLEIPAGSSSKRCQQNCIHAVQSLSHSFTEHFYNHFPFWQNSSVSLALFCQIKKKIKYFWSISTMFDWDGLKIGTKTKLYLTNKNCTNNNFQKKRNEKK